MPLPSHVSFISTRPPFPTPRRRQPLYSDSICRPISLISIHAGGVVNVWAQTEVNRLLLRGFQYTAASKADVSKTNMEFDQFHFHLHCSPFARAFPHLGIVQTTVNMQTNQNAKSGLGDNNVGG